MSNELSGSLVSVGTLIGGINTLFGVDGKSAYQIAVDNGFVGTEAEWLESLKAFIENGSITPELLDREYWQKINRTTVTGYDGLDSILAEENASDTIYKIAFTGLSPIYKIVGEGSFVAVVNHDLSGLILHNTTNGQKWSYKKGSNDIIPCVGIQKGLVTPELLDREYFSAFAIKKVMASNPTITLESHTEYRITEYAQNLTINLPEGIADDFVCNVVFQSGTTATALTSPSSINWSGDDVTDNSFVPQSDRNYNVHLWYDGFKVNAIVRSSESDKDVVLIKVFNSIEEMQAYSFDKNKLYHFFVAAQVGALLGGEGCCFGRYTETTDPETDEVVTRMIEVLNSSTLMVWMLNLTEGTAELKTGVSTVDTELSETSENAVQNKVLKAELDKKLDNFENLPTIAIDGDYTCVKDYMVFSRSKDGEEGITGKISLTQLQTLLFKTYALNEGNTAYNTILAKQDKKITDTGEYFTAEDVEGALQEIGSILSELNAYDVVDIVKMNIKQTALATNCGGLLANIKDNIIMSCSASQGWTDMPNSSGDIFINWRYGTNYNIQLSFDQTTGVTLRRIVNRNTGVIYNDWKLLDGTPYVNILALGDSICRGVRNSNKGFVGDLGFPYKNIGVSSATISNVTTSVTNIPDQLVNLKTEEPDYVPDIIIAEGGINDWSQGAALGNMFDGSGNPITEEVDMLNRSTVIGGLEYLFYKMITLYPNAQRFFLITHKTYKTSTGNYCPVAANSAGWTQQDLHDAIVKCCKVYNVKVIDVYEESMINSLYSQYRSEVAYNDDNSVTDTQYVDADGVHPLAYGYKQGYVPLIRQAIRIGTDT